MNPNRPDTDAVYRLLGEIPDPEVPVLSILDLGIVRNVILHPEETEVVITATYTGCPAMDWIATQIRAELEAKGCGPVRVTRTIAPAWTTDWMSETGKENLKAYGIAPPDKRFQIPDDGVACPRCGSEDTHLLSAFGSTACKALYQCRSCQEPFDYFKCH